MGSSAKTGKFFFRGSPEHFLDKNTIWDRTPRHLHINCSLHVWGRAQGSQIFKQNSIISIRSKVMAFLVISLSPHGPCHPCIIPTSSPSSPHHPHIILVVPTSSPHHPCHPCHPHIIPIAPRRSPCGLHGLWSPWPPHVVPCIVPTSSPHRPHCSHHPHIIPIAPRRSPCGHPPWSVVSMVSSCCPRHPRVVPVIPTSSPHHRHII